MKHSILRLAYIAMTSAALVLTGCGPENVTDAAHEEQVGEQTSLTGMSEGYFYRAAFGADIDRKELQRLTSSPTVLDELDRLAIHGYQTHPEYAMEMRANRPGESESFRLAILPLENGTPNEAVYLFQCRWGDRSVAVPVRFVQVGDEVRWKVLDPVDPLAFPWRQWAGCVAGRIAGGMVGCWRGCRLALFARLECMKVCAGGVALASLVSCTVQFIIA